MSLTQPPPPEPEVERRPSRRFTILFTLAMLIIAVGYMWVWQAKTSRVVAEPPPDLVLGRVTSSVPVHDESALRDSIVAGLRSVPRLQLSESVDDIETREVLPGRLPQRAYILDGALDRDETGTYSLALQRIDAGTDSLVYIYRVHGQTLSEVVHRMAVQVAMSFGLALPDTAAVPRPTRKAPAAGSGEPR